MNHSSLNSIQSPSMKRWSVLRATFLTYFYDSYDLAILAVVMPVLMVSLNIDTTIGGILHSSTMIGAIVGSILIGYIAEHWGHKLALIISLIEFSIGSLLIYLVDSWQGWAILRFITGIGLGGVWGPCMALLSASWSSKYLARASAFMFSTFAIAWICSAILGKFLLQADWRILFLIGASAIFVAMYVAIAVPNQRPSLNKDTTKPISLSLIFQPPYRKKTILAICQNMCQMAGFWGANAWIPTYLVNVKGLPLSEMATFLILMYSGMFVGYQFFGFLGDKWGRRNTLLLAFLLNAVTVTLYLMIDSISLLFWFSLVLGFAFSGITGLLGAFYSELFPEHIKALASGFCFNFGRIGAVIAPFTVGLLGSYYGLAFGIIVCSGIYLIGFVITLFLPETLKTEKKLNK